MRDGKASRRMKKTVSSIMARKRGSCNQDLPPAAREVENDGSEDSIVDGVEGCDDETATKAAAVA